jgi:hypothetical protein
MPNNRRGTNIIVMNIKKKVRQYRSNQGRSPQQQESNNIAMFVSFIGFVVTFTGLIIWNLFN